MAMMCNEMCNEAATRGRRAAVLRRRLAERQTKSGGLNGRPEKLQDVCYSWWCLSALAILRRLHWIDRDALSAFILQCQVRPAALCGNPLRRSHRCMHHLLHAHAAARAAVRHARLHANAIVSC